MHVFFFHFLHFHFRCLEWSNSNHGTADCPLGTALGRLSNFARHGAGPGPQSTHGSSCTLLQSLRVGSQADTDDKTVHADKSLCGYDGCFYGVYIYIFLCQTQCVMLFILTKGKRAMSRGYFRYLLTSYKVVNFIHL